MLRDAGFDGMPTPWGLVTWRPPDGAETLAASVDEYLPGAVDGWTWAVDLITAAARDHRPNRRVDAAAASRLTWSPSMHAALADTATVASRHDAARWRDTAFDDARNRLRSLPDSQASRLRARAGRDRDHPGRARHAGRHPGHRGTRRSARRSGAAQRRPVRGDRLRRQPGTACGTANAADSRGARRRRHGPVARARRDRRPQARRPRHRSARRVDTLARAAFLDAYADRIGTARSRRTCTTRPRSGRSGCSRCCARSSMRQGICPAGCMCPTRHYPLSSTKGCRW